MAEPVKRPSTREGRKPRSHSAKARITPVPPPISMDHSEQITKELEAAKSAKAIKNKHTSSAAMFVVRPPSRSAPQVGKARFTSMYSNDFEGSFVPPAEIRPTSPTRRNNPHPTKVRVCKAERGWGSLSLAVIKFVVIPLAIYGLEGSLKRDWSSAI